MDTYCSCYDYSYGEFYPCTNDKCNWNWEMLFWTLSMADSDYSESISRCECDALYDWETIGFCHEMLDHCDADGSGDMDTCEFK